MSSLRLLNRGEIWLWIAILLANLLNFLHSSIVNRNLTFAEFAPIAFISNMQILLSTLALALEFTLSKRIARYRFKPNQSMLIAGIGRSTLFLALVVTCMLLFTSPAWENFFQLDLNFIQVLLVSSLGGWMLISSLIRGIASGMGWYLILSSSSIAETITKLSIVLWALIDQKTFHYYALISIPLGIIASALIPLALSLFKSLKHYAYLFSKFTAPTFFSQYKGVVMTLIASQLIISLELLAIKPYVSNHIAGQYATLSLLSRIIIYITSSLIGVLIPRLSALAATKSTSGRLSLRLGLFVVLTGATLTLSMYFFPQYTIALLAGTKALALVAYIPLMGVVAIITSLNVMYITQSIFLSKHIKSLAIIFILVCEILVLRFIHDSLLHILLIQAVSALSIFIVVASHTYQVIKEIKKPPLSSTSSSNPSDTTIS